MPNYEFRPGTNKHYDQENQSSIRPDDYFADRTLARKPINRECAGE